MLPKLLVDKRIIRSAKHLKRLKIKKKPPLNDARKSARLQFAKAHMTWNKEWKTVIFSDEKKFNLDGPDGYNYYFHDLRKEECFLSRHHTCQGGVMVWGAISFYGTCELQFVTSKMNANDYKKVLQNAFPQISEIYGRLPWTYQHDNAPIHTARVVKQWIQDQNVKLLDWPPYSPDINIMENMWGLLSRRVYEDGRQFSDSGALVKAIKEAWATITLNEITKYYDSLPNRIFEVIKNVGGHTKY
nr:uncharacterized protein LOC108120241 isoform X2 [Drosophila bipectinata]